MPGPICQHRNRNCFSPFGPPIRQTQGKIFKERGELEQPPSPPSDGPKGHEGMPRAFRNAQYRLVEGTPRKRKPETRNFSPIINRESTIENRFRG